MESNPEKTTPRIAILAVHGVADQKRYATQQATAGLLLSGEQQSLYTNFTESQTLIAQNPVVLSREIDTGKTRSDCSGIQGISATATVSRIATYPPEKQVTYTDENCEQADLIAPLESNLEPVDINEWTEHESMREQLQGLADSDLHSMEVRVLSGHRKHPDGSIETGVDIYEMHWADLSRIGNHFFSFLFEFYLLLYFLPRIGTLTLERARPCAPDKNISFRIAFYSHLIAEYLTVIVIPAMHLCVLSMGVTVLPFVYLKEPEDTGGGSSIALLIILGAVALFLITRIFKYGRSNDQYWNLYFIPVALLFSAAIGVFLTGKVSPDDNIILQHLLVCLLLWFMLRIYNDRQPGVRAVGGGLLLATLLLFIGLLSSSALLDSSIHLIGQFSQRTADGIIKGLETGGQHQTPQFIVAKEIFEAGAIGSQLIALATAIAISLFVLFAFISFVAGVVAAGTAPAAERDASARLFWTSSITLVVSGLLSILITFSLWELIYRSTEIMFRHFSELPLVPDTLRAILESLFSPGLAVIAATVLIAVGYAAWAICPAPLSDGIKNKRDVAGLGRILDRGFTQMNYSSWAIMFVLFALIPILGFYKVTTDTAVQPHEHYIVLGLALLIIVSMFGHGPVGMMKKGFGAVLDIALDVTNWFRITPRENNAKAAICRRYVSLLRHIANWRDPHTGKPYDGLVIVAHSQGTVITADLLRFLKREQSQLCGGTDKTLQALLPADGNSSSIPIDLLSFGSPLRQLYNRRFPHQYQWCEYSETDSHRNGPDPSSLGVASWRNLYMSGDYVGRHLWYSDTDNARFDTSQNKTAYSGTASEQCAGFGGHTAYWSGEVPEVGAALDKIIKTAAGRKQP
ncbi:hypothetical protein AB833_22960 [Chromatiales bacterium (ex Bugula neritina AB1)]|nr:hypothetical protein AB833_22960 [Chromatiales bacterium (ex Bugula neritina AB1)]